MMYTYLKGGKMPKISVIVPVYNSDAYLNACIDSILAQSFEDYELILVNDGSTDNCGNICDTYANSDTRIRVIHQANQGQASARNHGITVACGEWICFVDSDDIIHPQMLEILYQAVISTNTNISMCSAIEDIVCPNTFFIQQSPSFVAREMNEKKLLELYTHVKYKAWIVCGKLIKKQIVTSIPFTNGKIYEDNAVVCRWLVKANKIADIDLPLYFYRNNPIGTTKCTFQLKHLDYLWALEQMILFFEHCNYPLLIKHFTEIYLITASYYYNKTLNELKSKATANDIRKKIRNTYHAKKSIITLSKENRRAIYIAIYPYSKFFWHFLSHASRIKTYVNNKFIHPN